MKISLVDIAEILHSGEGGDVEQWLESRNKFSCVCVWFLLAPYCFTFLLLWYYLSCFSLLHSVHPLAFRSILISIRKQLSTLTHLEESKRRSFRAIHQEFGFNFLFWVTACIIYLNLFLKVHLISITLIHPPYRCFSKEEREKNLSFFPGIGNHRQ